MAGTASILKELHRLRRHIKDLEAKIEQAPKQLAIHKKKLANQEEIFKQAQDHIKSLVLQTREKEGAIKSVQAQINKYLKQLDGAANKKEYDTLQSEITS